MESNKFYEAEIDDLEVSQNIDRAFDNSYEVVMGIRTFEDIMDEEGQCYLVFDIEDYDEKSILQQLLEWYESGEEYERCSLLLKKIKDGSKRKD